ncbi:Chemotaxis response regulator protein-glutamate methylesterase [uncultured archaeon]|nr:Chemotaxis response regulator protein-glutamate methylesterase [uncultured archaeon]
MCKEKSKSILVVNSDPDIADLFAEMLRSDENNYIVTTTFTGKECLWEIGKNKPDMVLMDIELPDMNGWDLTGKIKANNPDMPIVVITSKIDRKRFILMRQLYSTKKLVNDPESRKIMDITFFSSPHASS